MPTTILADAYMPQGRNVRVPTSPGRFVQFFGGHATIVNHLDMPHVLQMDKAKVQPRPEAMAWAPDWLRHVPVIKADVDWPEGWRVEHVNQDEFLVYVDETYVAGETPVTSTQTEPVTTVDMTARQFGPFNPEDLLLGPEESSEPVKPSRRSTKKAS